MRLARTTATGRLGLRLLRGALAPALELVAALRASSPMGPPSPRSLVIVDEHIPDPRLGAGYPRSRAFIEAVLKEGWSVVLIVTNASRYEAALFAATTRLAVRVERARGAQAILKAFRRVAKADALLISRPPNLAALKADPQVMAALKAVCPVIYDAEAIFSQREDRRRRLFGQVTPPWRLEAALRGEIEASTTVDAVVAVSSADAEIFTRGGARHVRVVGHLCPTAPGARRFEDRADILFVGRLDGPRQHSPNVDSICWFCEEILPLLNRLITTPFAVHVVGEVRSADVEALASAQVRVHGRIDDLATLFDASRIFIAPTRFSAGIPHKIHEAASRGLPCVATTQLALQAGLGSQSALLTADTASDFARACAHLYLDPVLWSQTRTAALNACERICSPGAFQRDVAAVLQLVGDISHRPPAGSTAPGDDDKSAAAVRGPS